MLVFFCPCQSFWWRGQFNQVANPNHLLSHILSGTPASPSSSICHSCHELPSFCTFSSMLCFGSTSRCEFNELNACLIKRSRTIWIWSLNHWRRVDKTYGFSITPRRPTTCAKLHTELLCWHSSHLGVKIWQKILKIFPSKKKFSWTFSA